MKKALIGLIVLTILNVPHLNAMQEVYNTCKKYVMERLYKPRPLPYSTEIFHEFTTQKDNNNKVERVEDAQEFGCKYFKDMHEKCDALQKEAIKTKKWPADIKDNALLHYTDTMLELERLWDSWHIVRVKGENGWEKHYSRLKIDMSELLSDGTKDPELDKDRQSKDVIKIFRQDIKSPYYKISRFSENITLDEIKHTKLDLLNCIENTAYHDELKFLQTQLHKMDLYLNIRPIKQPVWNNSNYRKQRKVLANHIEWFKSKKGRESFTHSYMPKEKFADIQQMRDGYKKSRERYLPIQKDDL